jgi:hypothetical protein
MTRPKTTPPLLPGKASLFRQKVRAPVSITLTRRHHQVVKRNMRRLGLSRSDFFALLVEKHADEVTLSGLTPD